ncbi:transcriptional regulator, LysR family [Agrobacterium sp. 719_389]|nr:transcriptional regulator, LysR family [Agrobacterium sp. 719_389]
MRRKRPKDGHPPSLARPFNGRIPMVALVHILAVAEYLSFHRAAQALGTSQSSVSARIKALEGDLGIILFDRNTRGVRLTEAGRRFVDQVDDALGILDRAIKTAGMQARGEDGELRIGVYALTAGCFLDLLFERFNTENPGICLHFTEGTARDAQLMVREGLLDVAFMADVREIADLNSRVIWRDRLMVALPVEHPLTAQPDVEWRQLVAETFLVRHGGTGPQLHDLIVARSSGKWVTPTIRRANVGRGALLSMIAAGHGISLFVTEGAAASKANVVFLPIRDEFEPLAFSAVWSPSNRNPALVKLLAMTTESDRPGR